MLAKAVSLLLITQLVHCDSPCTTPNGRKGSCVPLSQCPSLDSLFDHGILSEAEVSYLRSVHCGFQENHPKVCCLEHKSRRRRVKSGNQILPDRDSCGLYTSEKIVGGEKTEIDEFPWMALLQYRQADGSVAFECGGVLISKRYVLTAAHCIIPSLVGVRLGEYDLDTDPDCVRDAFGTDCAPPPLDLKIEQVKIHPDYDQADIKHFHDIALIRLNKNVEFSDFVKPICLPSSVEDYDFGRNLTVAGWGKTEKKKQSNIKLKVTIPVRQLGECEQGYRRYDHRIAIGEGQICAGGVKGEDSCKGDSGGPLMDLRIDEDFNPRFFVVGVVSYGPNPCGKQGLPGVYTKVANYASWIVNSLRP